ncbi:MAG TPA: hypothetical protein VMB05_16810 [Solirubrobacteraceae bacterium]|nr:hypothetical protein [Solirubrobacteraceae bacterium]
MAYRHVLNEKQLAELVNDVPSLNEEQARAVARRIQTAGAQVIEEDDSKPSIDELVEALEQDPNVAIQEGGMLPLPNGH